MLYTQSLQVIALALAAALILASEGSYLFGRRVAATRTRSDSDVVSTLQSALLALLGLLLAFTFGMANSRYEQRKALVVEEANDIGTTWLRTAFLPEPQRSVSRGVLAEYLSQRIRLYDQMEKDVDAGSLTAFLAEASRQHGRLWALAATAADADPHDEMVALYVSSLNATIDVHASRVAAARNQVPEVTLVMLFVMSMGAACSIGYTAGTNGSRSFWSTAVFHLLVVMVIIAILDIDRPRHGFIRVAQTPLIELLDEMSRTNE